LIHFYKRGWRAFHSASLLSEEVALRDFETFLKGSLSFKEVSL